MYEGQFVEPGMRKIIGELSRSSPLCGAFQFCGDDEVINLLNTVVKGTIESILCQVQIIIYLKHEEFGK